MEQLTQQLGLSQQQDNEGEVFYQVSLGEYPKTRVNDDTQDKLDQQLKQMLAKQAVDQDFACTGRLYTVIQNGSDEFDNAFFQKQCSEFSYQGEKYVCNSKYDHNRWFKVEPITFRVTNYAEVASGKAKQIDLESTHVINNAMFHSASLTQGFNHLWQNSLLRAFLNSADVRQLDGNPNYGLHDVNWNFKQTGFLQQALNMKREPTRVYTIPEHEKIMGEHALRNCLGLQKIIIPGKDLRYASGAFQGCRNAQIWVELSPCQNFQGLDLAIEQAHQQNLYFPKRPDGKWVVLSPYPDQSLAQDYFALGDCREYFSKLANHRNYRENFIQLRQWKESKKIKFIPPEFTLEIFPAGEMQNYWKNNNHKRWAELVKQLHFGQLKDENVKTNALTDLMKIYYALGGFSAHQGERDQAFQYVIQHVANEHEHEGAKRIHQRFSGLVLKGPYNPTFAKFFMRYYQENPDFMKFDSYDYLCAAHNSFDQILKTYPNRVVNGNTQRDLLSPQFVAEHCSSIEYDHVEDDNRELAQLVGHYGYTQQQFEQIQKIYDEAKKLKDSYVISADRAVAENGVSFRVLKKDDPLGFVIGNITNCCQHIDGAGAACVRDGYTNPNAGFLVFEETENQRILGQAYIWYDPETQTVCYDNIEIPNKILQELRRGEKDQGKLSINTLMKTVVNSADEIMTTMNQNGVKVKRVTVGKGYNDLRRELDQQFQLTEERAIHRNYSGYTDAREQYLIRTYDETTAQLARDIMDTAEQIIQADKTKANEQGVKLR